MIKKTYIAPRIKSLNLEPQSIVCGSGGGTEKMSVGDTSSSPAPTSAESNTRVGGSLWD